MLSNAMFESPNHEMRVVVSPRPVASSDAKNGASAAGVSIGRVIA